MSEIIILILSLCFSAMGSVITAVATVAILKNDISWIKNRVEKHDDLIYNILVREHEEDKKYDY